MNTNLSTLFYTIPNFWLWSPWSNSAQAWKALKLAIKMCSCWFILWSTTIVGMNETESPPFSKNSDMTCKAVPLAQVPFNCQLSYVDHCYKRNMSYYWVLGGLVFLIPLFGYVYHFVPITKHPHDVALGSTVGKYAFNWVPVTSTVCFIMFSEGLKPFFTSEF